MAVQLPFTTRSGIDQSRRTRPCSSPALGRRALHGRPRWWTKLAATQHINRPLKRINSSCQYTSLAFGERCRQWGVAPSMGSAGNCYDNAMAESFFATVECELLDRTRFHDHRRHRGRSSSSSKDGITRTVATKGWVTSHPSTSKSPTRTLH